jgi:hypothetical protein
VNVLNTLITYAILWAMLAVPAMPQGADPPRRAARLGYVGGAVSLTPAGLQEATPAELNRTFTTGDRFWSGADGRGELQTENAAIRFDGRASFAIQELSNQATLIRLESGALSVRLHALAPLEDFEIETPQFTFHFNRLGVYRVDAGEKGDTVTGAVRWGDAEVFRSDGAPTAVPRGKQARAAAGGNPAIEPANPLDQFEAWCVERDRREDLSGSAQYVSRDVPGYADLDEHGAWRTVDRYGMVWFPSNMDPDWAPYRAGHFVSTGAWGMNWVDDASWGFGPLHYGRWLKVDGSWGWVPGEAGKSAKSGAPEKFAVRPSYTPALVAWNRFAAGVVRPDAVVGWFPLGPGEAWAPQFQASANYVARVNLSNTAIADPAALGNFDKMDVTRVKYMYQEAMTAIGQEDLAAGHVVGRQYVRVPQTDYAQGMVSAQPGVEATREARLGPRGPAQGAPPEIANRSVVERRAPVPEPVPVRGSPNGITGGTTKTNRPQPEPQAPRPPETQAPRQPEPQTPRQPEPQAQVPPKPAPQVPKPAPQVPPKPAPQVPPKPAPQVAPKPAPRVSPKPTPRVPPKPTPRVAPKPTPRVPSRLTPQLPPRPKSPPRPQPPPPRPKQP